MRNLVARMDQVAQSYVEDNQFMGSAFVSKNDTILLDKGYGYANLEWQISNSPSTKFRLGSITKQFTAAAILLLEETGKITLDDPVKKYMPDTPASWDKITLFHLLTHTSGIPNYTAFPEFSTMTTRSKTPEQQIDVFRNRPLDFDPGSNYAYNNSGYVLLGYLIEKISGQPYHDFITNAIFKPLNMHDSGYDTHAAIISQRASGYDLTPNGFQNADYLDMSLPYSAGSLYSTTHDLYQWVNSLMNGKIISMASVKKMTTPFKNNYGFGVIINSMDGYQIILHAGGINGFNTILIHSPEDNLTVAVLSNLNTIGYVGQNIAFKLVKLARNINVILPSERNGIILPSESLLKFTGTYQLKSTNMSYSSKIKNAIISVENKHLIVQVENQPKILLYPESNNTFFGKIPDIQIEFHMRQDNISDFILYQDGEQLLGANI